jgi:hypothetical protein
MASKSETQSSLLQSERLQQIFYSTPYESTFLGMICCQFVYLVLGAVTSAHNACPNAVRILQSVYIHFPHGHLFGIKALTQTISEVWAAGQLRATNQGAEEIYFRQH